MVQYSREQKQERESQEGIFFLKGCQAMSSERKEGT